jgi:hypothetical protein
VGALYPIGLIFVCFLALWGCKKVDDANDLARLAASGRVIAAGADVE